MVKVMVVCASPEWKEVVQAPGEFVTAVRIDRLEQSQYDPDVHGEDVEVAGDSTPQNRAAHSAETQDHDFNRRGIFRGHSEGGGVLMVDLMDGLVERSPMEGTVREVMPRILQHEEDGNLVSHRPERGEGNRGGKTKELSHGVEKPVELSGQPQVAGTEMGNRVTYQIWGSSTVK